MLNSFHGRSMGALSATGQPKYHLGVGPMLAGFTYAPFGDLDAVAKLIDDETCAILVEPIQGEGGINLPPDGYLAGLRALADKHKLLLIFDEVQTGMGRTGTWFAFQQFGVEPDVVTLAKALAGGIACGGLLAKKAYAEKLVPGADRYWPDRDVVRIPSIRRRARRGHPGQGAGRRHRVRGLAGEKSLR